MMSLRDILLATILVLVVCVALPVLAALAPDFFSAIFLLGHLVLVVLLPLLALLGVWLKVGTPQRFSSRIGLLALLALACYLLLMLVQGLDPMPNALVRVLRFLFVFLPTFLFLPVVALLIAWLKLRPWSNFWLCCAVSVGLTVFWMSWWIGGLGNWGLETGPYGDFNRAKHVIEDMPNVTIVEQSHSTPNLVESLGCSFALLVDGSREVWIGWGIDQARPRSRRGVRELIECRIECVGRWSECD